MRRFQSLLLLICPVLAYTQITINPGDSIQSKINANPAGTTFTINAGTYRIVTPLVPKTGDSFIGATPCNTNPISSPGSCAAVISGSIIIGPSAVANYNGSGYYGVTGMTQQGSTAGQSSSDCETGYDGCFYPEDLFFDGTPLLHLASSTLPTISTGQWWFDYTNHVIYFYDNPSGHVVETSITPGIAYETSSPTASNVTFQYITFEEFAVPNASPNGGIWPWAGGGSDAYRQANGLNWVVENCEFWGIHGLPVNPNYGIRVLNNYSHNNGDFGFGGGGSDNNGTPSGYVFQGNYITANNYSNYSPGVGAGGIKFGNTYNITVRGNLITNNDGAGIHLDDDSSGGLIDGNTVQNNVGAPGIVYEIGLGSPTIRNNIVQWNGSPDCCGNPGSDAPQIQSLASTGMQAYCNVTEVNNLQYERQWAVNATNRTGIPSGLKAYSTGNYFHHNTAIWDSGATGYAGYTDPDAANQPNFFANNTPPDNNTYHMANTAALDFVYDNNSSGKDTLIPFATYQSNGADTHGTIDTIYTSGFPSVSITTPDQSTFANLLSVSGSATDPSGISKVEFYVDWTLKATVFNAPFSFKWVNQATASHTVAAMAYSNAGIRSCYAVTLNIIGSADPGGLVL